MNITITDIIKKHKTNINTENMSKKLQETLLFSDNPQTKPLFNDETITLNDIPQPKHTTNEKTETYTYKFKEYIITINYTPQDYRSMTINITQQPTNKKYDEPISYDFNYKGEQWGVKY